MDQDEIYSWIFVHGEPVDIDFVRQVAAPVSESEGFMHNSIMEPVYFDFVI